MAQVMKAKREENIPVLSGRLVLFTESLSQTINNKLLVWRLYTCSVYVMNSMLLPRFSIFANLGRSAEFFLQGSAKIVALNLEDPFRSTRFLQKCADFLQRFVQKYVFLQLRRNQYTAFLDFFNYFIQYFS